MTLQKLWDRRVLLRSDILRRDGVPMARVERETLSSACLDFRAIVSLELRLARIS